MDILFERALALKACVLSREAMQTRAMWLAFLHLILSVSIAVQAPVGSLFKAWYLVAPLTAKRCPLLAIVIKYLVSWVLDLVPKRYGDTVKRVPSGDVPFELCYEVLKQEAFQGFPVITFHLQNNADIILDAESAFLIGKEDCFRSS
ncbi:hypothetical protein L3X38_021832 [Prunus dulcis]|uniref:Uncharacterized protein n=1 Tax=Prunus dulcis TaxID=3755 RepID=A0AAD4VVT1_PRUDU|nr:hypothetical protein L3X38_021832 [Prunus dulcis]